MRDCILLNNFKKNTFLKNTYVHDIKTQYYKNVQKLLL